MTLLEAYRKASSLCTCRLVECAINSGCWRFLHSGPLGFREPILISKETGELLPDEDFRKYKKDDEDIHVYEIMPDGTFVRFMVADKVRLTRELVFTSFIDDNEKLTLPAGTEVWMAEESIHFLEYFSEDWLEKELYPYQYTYEFGDVEPVEYRRDSEGLTYCPLVDSLIENIDCFKIMEVADELFTEDKVPAEFNAKEDCMSHYSYLKFHLIIVISKGLRNMT